MFPTASNSQTTDTVSQTTVLTVGTAGSVARGVVNQSFAAAMAAADQNATAQQEASQVLADAALAFAIKRMGKGA